MSSFGDVIDKVAGKSGFGSKLLEAIKDIAGSGGGGSSNAFGMYLTEASFGILFEFPASDAIQEFLPPFVPEGFAGTLKLRCHVDISGSDPDFKCGMDYGGARWLAAVWKDINKVVTKIYGAVKNTADEAVADARTTADKTGKTITGAAGAVANFARKTGDATASVVRKVFDSGRRRRRFLLRRRRRNNGRRRRRRL